MKIKHARFFLSLWMAISLALLALVPFSTAVSATGTSLSIGAPATVPVGDNLVVNINIGAVTNLNGFQFDLTYNNSVIQLTGMEGGSGVGSGLVGSTATPVNAWGFIPSGTPGVVRVLGNLPGTSGATGQGYLAQINFNAVGIAGQSSSLNISNIQLVNNTGDMIAATASSGSVTVIAPQDTTRPTVVSTNPASGAGGVAVNALITATFSEAIKSSTVTGGTFSLMSGATPVTGNVSCAGNTATFTPGANLSQGTTYTATITTGVKDLADNALASNYTWSFTTGGQPPATTMVSVGLASGNVTQGNPFSATINVGAVTNFNSYQFDLVYDSSVVRIAGNEGGPGVSGGLIGATVVPLAMWAFVPAGTQGHIRVLGNLPGAAGVTGEGYLAQVLFDVIGTVGQSSNLTLSNVALFKNNGTGMPSNTANGAVTVTASPPEITTASLAEAVAGVNYSSTLNAGGGKSPYAWSASGLPAGLTLSAAGVISGQPAASGDFSVVVTVADSSSPAATANRTLALHVYPALQITTSSLSNGSTAINCSTALSATGGKGSYNWNAAGLPAGLTLSAAGVLCGKPNSAGNFNVLISVTDGFTPANSTSKVISLKVYLAGDAIGDGSVNMADVTEIERIILGLDPSNLAADTNGDGQIDMADVTCVERIILGLQH